MTLSMNLSMIAQHETVGKQCTGEKLEANTAYIT